MAKKKYRKMFNDLLTELALLARRRDDQGMMAFLCDFLGSDQWIDDLIYSQRQTGIRAAAVSILRSGDGNGGDLFIYDPSEYGNAIARIDGSGEGIRVCLTRVWRCQARRFVEFGGFPTHEAARAFILMGDIREVGLGNAFLEVTGHTFTLTCRELDEDNIGIDPVFPTRQADWDRIANYARFYPQQDDEIPF